ncbi:MAG: sulfatase-like hydrolase/transferase, partial [Anaerolineales bacterium]
MSSNPTVEKRPFWYSAILLVYPFSIAYYPIFALRNHNIEYVDFSAILRSLILATAGTLLIGVVAFLISRSLEKSSVIASTFVILFLSYGQIYNQLEAFTGSVIRHRYLLGAELLVLLLVIFLVIKSDQVARVFSQFLAVVSLVLMIMVIYQSLGYDWGEYRASAAVQQGKVLNTSTQGAQELPDFYLIILDGNTRSDVLKARFGYDNSSFIQQLTDLGFYVAGCGQSNYASTKLSLVSAMYVDYIQDFIEAGIVLPPLENSPVNETLKSLGYQTITFENRARGQFDLNEDILLARSQNPLGNFVPLGGINEFEKMMVETSFVRFIVDTELIPGFDQDRLEEAEQWEHYYQTHYILTELTNLPETAGPKFVYAHIMVPHSPFIFAPDGSYQNNNDPIDGYRSNVEFIDNQLPSILRTIIEKSDPTPIIIVMGDHG